MYGSNSFIVKTNTTSIIYRKEETNTITNSYETESAKRTDAGKHQR
jgi:hypothetical protein